MASIHDIREGMRVRIEGVITNIRDISDPEAGPFESVADIPDTLNASWCIQTNLRAPTGHGRAILVLFAGDADHAAMKVVERR